MVNISELQDYLKKYRERKKPLFENDTIKGFIGFVDSEQRKNKKTGIVSLEKREAKRRLKELEERQRENKRINPEEDFNNLED